MAGEEPITSPDQHRPTISKRLARFGLLATVLILVAMALGGNHEGRVEDIWVLGIAGLLLLILIVDFILRRTGLRSE
ncbi:MAG TPA: DUF2631 domain-containing protein [Micromonosporaceae bacterium]|nr:DUF2631 domain-containing protein [Micromonosporaceae bacterium]